jgi:hypothetical protein
MEKSRNVSSDWAAEATRGPEEQAGVAQLVEYKLPKLGVAGSNPVARSISSATHQWLSRSIIDS